MAYKIFIDGKEGTTGLQIFERFKNRQDIELLQLSEDERKNADARAALINESDFTFLCLPDEAARESVSLCKSDSTRIIDASTAHRTADGWTYGFPELAPKFRSAIETSKRVAVPGCYASGFASICFPLVSAGVLPRDYPVVCHAISGYSGAGKKGIAQYESAERFASGDSSASGSHSANGDSSASGATSTTHIDELKSPRMYALTQAHKHLPEMQKISGLDFAPIFNPYVCDFYAGMTVTISLHTRLLSRKISPQEMRDLLAMHYAGCRFVSVAPLMGDGVLHTPFIPANTLAGTNNMRLFVCGNSDRIVITSQLDNLGKGASGAAVQCLNIMMGIDEGTGL